MSDDLKVGAAGNAGQNVGQVNGVDYEQKRAELEQKQLTEGLAGNKKKTIEDEETVTVTVENGESLAKIAKKYGVSVQEIMDLNEKQIKYFKNATDCNDDKKYAGFLVGAKIKLPSKANMKAVEENLKTTSEQERKKYEEAAKDLDTKLCDERTQSYRPLDENFRKQNNIRTRGEYEAEQNSNEDEIPKSYEVPDASEGDAAPPQPDAPAVKTPSRPIPLKPDENTPSYEPPTWEIPAFTPETPKGPDIQVPLRPDDEAEAAPPKSEAPAAKTPEKPKTSDDSHIQGPLRPDENTPAYETPTWEVPSFPGAAEQKNEPKNTETEHKNPSIQEMTDEANKRKNAGKPWWKFW